MHRENCLIDELEEISKQQGIKAKIKDFVDLEQMLKHKFKKCDLNNEHFGNVKILSKDILLGSPKDCELTAVNGGIEDIFKINFYNNYNTNPNVITLCCLESEYNNILEELITYFNLYGDNVSKSFGQDDEAIFIRHICFGTDGLWINSPAYGMFNLYYDPELELIEDSILYKFLGYFYKNASISPKAKNKIYFVYTTQHGYDKRGFEIKKSKINIDDNYNDDFKEVSKDIIKYLNKSNDNGGLIILNGDPGTGKTYFLRHLASKMKSRNIIFISPDMAACITDPSFVPFLLQNKDSILVIEDAEPVLESRKSGSRSNSISNILNLTEGLLSDALNITVVATFNSDLKNIDSALLRKGRLYKHYKFEPLSIDKSNKLFAKLGKSDIIVDKPMTLAQIYNYDIDNNSHEVKKSLGFGK